MAQQMQSWRDLLESLEVEEKLRIIEALGIQRKTWERWLCGSTALPHLGRIRQLLTVLPAHAQAQFLACIERDPKFAKYGIDQLAPARRRDISSTFYAHILEANVVTPEPLRFLTLCQLILLKMVGHLDTDRRGLYVVILTCTSPFPSQPVRTLSQHLALGAPPWKKVFQSQRYFLGSESLAGQAALELHPCIIQDLCKPEDFSRLSVYQDEHAASCAAVPLQRQGQIGGCLLSLSAQRDFFTTHILTIIRRYGELMAIALRDDEWYAPEQFALHTMPSASIQDAYLANFSDRVSLHCKDRLNWLEAERTVRQQIEAELVALTSQK